MQISNLFGSDARRTECDVPFYKPAVARRHDGFFAHGWLLVKTSALGLFSLIRRTAHVVTAVASPQRPTISASGDGRHRSRKRAVRRHAAILGYVMQRCRKILH
ncbi:hypothetical protein GCM10017653_25570 [Ancylobacter defluvii]|uniref:Uncharacterized protein n=1 Tax=Ancylobacter defluvii TaxID=1282440 RepID=A0A9W6JWE0_9HYPH|nr:hypothetical protein GCM10017653_25570 [Ancylobacter defluvii]